MSGRSSGSSGGPLQSSSSSSASTSAAGSVEIGSGSRIGPGAPSAAAGRASVMSGAGTVSGRSGGSSGGLRQSSSSSSASSSSAARGFENGSGSWTGSGARNSAARGRAGTGSRTNESRGRSGGGSASTSRLPTSPVASAGDIRKYRAAGHDLLARITSEERRQHRQGRLHRHETARRHHWINRVEPDLNRGKFPSKYDDEMLFGSFPLKKGSLEEKGRALSFATLATDSWRLVPCHHWPSSSFESRLPTRHSSCLRQHPGSRCSRRRSRRS